MARFRVWFTSCVLLMLVAVPLGAQSLPLSSALWMSKLTRPAGIIFSGAVVRIEREPDENGKPASVRIAFRAEVALRGCYAGETVEVAEWAELWVRHDRYRVGQQVLLFLYSRNAAGLTSPVGGDLGVFVLGSDGLLRPTPQQATLLGSQPGERPAPGESTNPTPARAGLRSFPEARAMIRSIEEEE
jgi:hypothetical protein